MFTMTNNKPRPLVSWHDIPQNIAADWFDYVVNEDDRWTPRFFNYRGSWYDVNDGFEIADNMPRGVDVWRTESVYSAVGIRYDAEYENVVVTYCHW